MSGRNVIILIWVQTEICESAFIYKQFDGNTIKVKN